MLCSFNFSITYETEILSTEASDFLKHMKIVMPFKTVLNVVKAAAWNY